MEAGEFGNITNAGKVLNTFPAFIFYTFLNLFIRIMVSNNIVF